MEKKNKSSKIALIVILVVGIIILLRLGILVLFASFVSSNNISFETNDNITNINNNQFTLKEDNAYYDEESKCFIINVKLNRNKDIKQNIFTHIFGTNTMDITYKLYDKEGYSIGEAFGYIDDISSETKWKLKLSYCDIDSNEVSNYNLFKITKY